MGFLLDYFVVALLLGQVAASTEGEARLKHKDASLALQEVASKTGRKEVAAASWALSAIPLYRVESVFEFDTWLGGVVVA